MYFSYMIASEMPVAIGDNVITTTCLGDNSISPCDCTICLCKKYSKYWRETLEGYYDMKARNDVLEEKLWFNYKEIAALKRELKCKRLVLVNK